MPDRGASAPVLAEMAKSQVRVCHLLEIDFGSAIVRLTDGPVDIVWGSSTYLASALLGFSGFSETLDLLVNRATVSLNGVDQAAIALLLSEQYMGRKASIRKAFLDEDLQLITDPVLIVHGTLDKPNVSLDPDAGTADCTVDVVSVWSAFEARRGRRTNDREQQFHFPGDTGFRHITGIPKNIFWGTSSFIDNGRAPGESRFTKGRRRKG